MERDGPGYGEEVDGSGKKWTGRKYLLEKGGKHRKEVGPTSEHEISDRATLHEAAKQNTSNSSSSPSIFSIPIDDESPIDGDLI